MSHEKFKVMKYKTKLCYDIYCFACFCNIATVHLSRASSKIKRVLGTSWKLFVCPAWILSLKEKVLVLSIICMHKFFKFFWKSNNLQIYFLFKFCATLKIFKFSTTNPKLGEGKEKKFLKVALLSFSYSYMHTTIFFYNSHSVVIHVCNILYMHAWISS